MTSTQEQVSQTLEGETVGRSGSASEQVWLDLFDDLFAEDHEELVRYQRYYDGDQNIKWNDARFKEIFGKDFTGVRDNWCEVVVDACADRMTLTGFTVSRIEGEDTDTNSTDTVMTAEPTTSVVRADTPLPGMVEQTEDPLVDLVQRKVRAIMKRNKYQSMQHTLHVKAQVQRRGYLIVWHDAKDPALARIWFNEATLIRVWYDENGEVEAAAKRWQRPDGKTRQNLYFRDRIEKWVLEDLTSQVDLRLNQRPAPGQTSNAGLRWVTFADDDDTTWPILNPYDRVPVFAFINKRHSSLEGLSEIETTVTIQDAINKTINDGMVASEYAAFTQKAIASKGRPKDGWKHGPNMLWSTTDTDARFHQFDPTPLENFVTWVDMLVNHVAGTSRTPQYMFFTTGQVPSGESLKTVDSGLVNKTQRKCIDFGDEHEAAMLFAVKIELGDQFPADLTLESEWAPVQTRMEKEFWEVQQIKGRLGVSTRQLLREGDYGDEEISIFEQELANEQQESVANDMLRSFMSGVGNGGEQPPVLPPGPNSRSNR